VQLVVGPCLDGECLIFMGVPDSTRTCILNCGADYSFFVEVEEILRFIRRKLMVRLFYVGPSLGGYLECNGGTWLM